MYSHAQCTMQERSVCCRDVPCLSHMELGSGPLHSEHLPPFLSAWGNGDSVYWQPSRRMYPACPVWSWDLAPYTLSTYPPSYLPGVMGTQFTGSLQEGWTWTVEWRFTASPTQILWFRIMYVILYLFHLESCFWSVYQKIVCLVLIAVIFFRLINHKKE